MSERYNKSKKTKKGRPKGSKKNNIILLDYRSWTIECNESTFPSANFILKKKGTKNIAYCSNLESALSSMYEQMLIDNVNRKNHYGSKFNDLKNLILETKNDLSELLDVSPIINNKINGAENETTLG